MKLSIADFTMVTTLDPQNMDAFTQRGIAHDKLKLYQQSLLDFSTALQINPTDITLLLCRSSV